MHLTAFYTRVTTNVPGFSRRLPRDATPSRQAGAFLLAGAGGVQDATLGVDFGFYDESR